MSPEVTQNEAVAHDDFWVALIRWRGVILIGVAIVVTIWLGITGQLILYINPQYVVFTIIMAFIALGLLLASFIVRAAHSHEDDSPTGSQKAVTLIGGVLSLVLAVGMIVVPPATLSSATAIQRDVNASTVGANAVSVASVSSASKATYLKFTVLDWSSLLRQTSDPGFYVGKPADVIGFVTPDSADPKNLFYLTRFVITCCVLDAQPVAVPVYLPGWKSKFSADKWLQVSGGFVAEPGKKSLAQIVLVPSKVAIAAKPAQPYLF